MNRNAICLLVVVLIVGCGERIPIIVSQYNSEAFGFGFTIPEDLERGGWGVIDAEDATVRHSFAPPDTSTWEAVAVIVPPGHLFPLLSPIFVDVFYVRDPATTPSALADKKVERVGARLLSRKSMSAGGLSLEQVVYGNGDDVTYETYAVGNNLGYAFLAQGAPDSTQTTSTFLVDSGSYDRIVSTFRLSTPR